MLSHGYPKVIVSFRHEKIFKASPVRKNNMRARETKSQYIIFKLNEIFERHDISVIPIKNVVV